MITAICCFKGSILLVGQADGQTLAYSLQNGQCLSKTRCHCDAVTAMCCVGETAYSAGADAYVFSYDVTAGLDVSFDLITRASAPLRALHVSALSVAASGDQMDVATFALGNAAGMRLNAAHRQPVVGCSFAAADAWLATLAYDGQCVVWRRQEAGSYAKQASFAVTVRSAKQNASLLAISWNDTSLLAVPSESSLLLFDAARGTQEALEVPLATPLVAALFSAGGTYLAVASATEAAVYHVRKRRWAAARYELGGGEAAGFLAVWKDAFSLLLVGVDDVQQQRVFSIEEADFVAAAATDEQEDQLFDDYDLEEAADEDEGDCPAVQSASAASPVQPGATAFSAGFRFLAYSQQMVVSCRQDETASYIAVDFADRSAGHAPIKFVDSQGLTMASASGGKGVAFAGDWYEAAGASTVRYVPYAAAAGAEWSVGLSEANAVVACAAASS